MADHTGVDWADGRWVVVRAGEKPRLTTEPSMLTVWTEHVDESDVAAFDV